MPTMNDYPIGAPCWFELATSDQAAAKNFYGALFGWLPVDSPGAGGMPYTIFQREGADAAACYQLMAEQCAAGVPPHWGVYFRVADVDASATVAQAHGGSLLMGPFDVGDIGRLVILKDPEGAAFSLWTPRNARNPGVVREDHAVTWVELATRDTARAAKFYHSLLGWDMREHVMSMPGTYRLASIEGEDCAGMLPMDANWEGIPSQWAVYVRVPDCDSAVSQVQNLGGKVLSPPFDAPGVGRLACVQDPQGAAFYVIRLDPEG